MNNFKKQIGTCPLYKTCIDVVKDTNKLNVYIIIKKYLIVDTKSVMKAYVGSHVSISTVQHYYQYLGSHKYYLYLN